MSMSATPAAPDASRVPFHQKAHEPTFEERWAAWQARGIEHDRAVRLKIATRAPLIAIGAAVLYWLLSR